MKKELDNLLSKKMDRRDFLKTVGVGLIGISGLGMVLKLSDLPGVVEKQQPQKQVASTAYGMSAYGR